MTRVLEGEYVAQCIEDEYPGVVKDLNGTDVWIDPNKLVEVASFLKSSRDLDFSFLTSITAVDYIDRFEVIYHLLSMRRNHSAVVKVSSYGREEPVLDSVISVWRGADLQEREIWDLMGIRFRGHPNMKRVLLWEGFPGHPLRKDFVR